MNMLPRQSRAPLAEAMKAYAADGAVAFHTPGHKQGRGAHPLLKALITPEGLAREVSLMEELDDLHAPFSCLKEAQELAAELYGADETLFMINGTSEAIECMLLSVLKPGEVILLPRNAHCSVLKGLVLCGAKPVYIEPEIDESLGIAMGLGVERTSKAIAAHPEAKALLVVYPTYYGVAADLAKLAALAHEHGMLLLADEAHGPHLPFADELPRPALACGADMAAQSTHKILGALTQASMLHIRSSRVDIEKVRSAASLLHSTSPDYLLLASLDIARLQMAESGQYLIGRSVKLAEKLRREINSIRGLSVFGKEIIGRAGCFSLDATKLTVTVAGLGLSGREAERILRHTYKVQCELSDEANVLFIISLADTEKEAGILLAALSDLAASCQKMSGEKPELFPLPQPETVLTPRQAFFAPSCPVPFAKAQGCISAEFITFYPPGVPVLCPGERLTEAVMGYIRRGLVQGRRVTGAADAALREIRIIKVEK